MKGSKIYLAIPYNHRDHGVREIRFRKANKIAGALFQQGHFVFSPISHSHPIACQYGLPKGYDFWKKWNRSFIEWCDMLYVVTIEGWEKSRGVQGEIQTAKEMGKEIVYIPDLTGAIHITEVTK